MAVTMRASQLALNKRDGFMGTPNGEEWLFAKPLTLNRSGVAVGNPSPEVRIDSARGEQFGKSQRGCRVEMWNRFPRFSRRKNAGASLL
jgi:hypothetical protein